MLRIYSRNANQESVLDLPASLANCIDHCSWSQRYSGDGHSRQIQPHGGTFEFYRMRLRHDVVRRIKTIASVPVGVVKKNRGGILYGCAAQGALDSQILIGKRIDEAEDDDAIFC